jgi:hypothetical protein
MTQSIFQLVKADVELNSLEKRRVGDNMLALVETYVQNTFSFLQERLKLVQQEDNLVKSHIEERVFGSDDLLSLIFSFTHPRDKFCLASTSKCCYRYASKEIWRSVALDADDPFILTSRLTQTRLPHL